MSIAENIKKLRDKYDLTQQELADIAGVTNKAVSAWETGVKEPRMGAIEKIAQHFKIKKSNIIEDGGMEMIHIETPKTIASQFNPDEYTEEELKEIMEYARYLKSKRK
ncbi:helix-turn-helix domain-containing protein [Paenibacillus macerans]|uniref:Helix-turn-helix domain-containing protein n=1 Tax=Paenibacillus macerans TaxID=44252 RepID=A0A6N8F0J8_PAEMA|nr:helix-turn-helix transcriptional regulator [Paenibacillus macerans]MUG26007.1 helix-turn-helix domain-containing protein [Paenibacillus macerans]